MKISPEVQGELASLSQCTVVGWDELFFISHSQKHFKEDEDIIMYKKLRDISALHQIFAIENMEALHQRIKYSYSICLGSYH